MRRLRAASAIAACLAASLACCVPGQQTPPAPPQPGAQPPAQPAVQPKGDGETWAKAPGEAMVLDGLELRVTGARLGKPKVLEMSGTTEVESAGAFLIVYMHARNLSDSRKIDRFHWLHNPVFNFDEGMSRRPTASDEHGNAYQASPFSGMKTAIDGHEILRDSLYPGKEADDVILMEPPIGKATMIKLTIPAPPPLQGAFRFLIPMAMVKK